MKVEKKTRLSKEEAVVLKTTAERLEVSESSILRAALREYLKEEFKK